MNPLNADIVGILAAITVPAMLVWIIATKGGTREFVTHLVAWCAGVWVVIGIPALFAAWLVGWPALAPRLGLLNNPIVGLMSLAAVLGAGWLGYKTFERVLHRLPGEG